MMQEKAGLPIWFQVVWPVVSFLAGLISGFWFDLLKLKESQKFETARLLSQRRELIRDRALEFQRSTLLELQELLVSIELIVSELHFAIGSLIGDGMRIKPIGNDLYARCIALQTQALKLVERVDDVDVRIAAMALLSTSTEAVRAKTSAENDAAFTKATEGFAEANTQIGKVLRNLFHAIAESANV